MKNSTIIGREEKNARFKEYRRKQRGSVSREEYTDQLQDRKEDKLWQLEKALERHPNGSQRELAAYLGWGKTTVVRYLNRLK